MLSIQKIQYYIVLLVTRTNPVRDHESSVVCFVHFRCLVLVRTFLQKTAQENVFVQLGRVLASILVRILSKSPTF